jgi:hypothetical protein
MVKREEFFISILALTEADSIDQASVDIDFQSMLSRINSSSSDLLAENSCIFE